MNKGKAMPEKVLQALALAAVIVCLPASAQQVEHRSAPEAARCDDLADRFVAVHRRTQGSVHSDALAVLRANGSTDRVADIPRLRILLAQVSSTKGPRSLDATLLRADLLRLGGYRDLGQQQVALERLRIAELLAGFDDLEALEVFLELTSSQAGLSRNAQAHAAVRRWIDAHRLLAGDVSRAAPLWRLALDTAPDRAARERTARDQLAAAERAVHARWLMEARSELIKVIVEARIGKDEQTADVDGTLLPLLRAALRTMPEVVNLARAALPEVARRAALVASERPAGDYCEWLQKDDAMRIARVLVAASDGSDRRAAVELMVRSAASRSPFDTDPAGAVNNMAPVVTARFFDREIYLEGMRAAGRSMDCNQAAVEICAMSMLAHSYIPMGGAGVGLALLQDALAAAEAAGAMPVDRAELLVRMAETQWRFGTASEAGSLLAAAENLLPREGQAKADEIAIRVLALRARMADAALDDRAALEAYGQLIDVAIRTNRARPSIASREAAGFGPETEPPSASEARQTVDELTRAHLRGGFCAGCGDGKPVADPTIAWLRALVDPRNEAPFVPTPAQLVTLHGLPASVWPAELTRDAFARWFANRREHQSDFHVDSNPSAAFAEVRRRFPNADNAAVLRVLALNEVLRREGPFIPATAARFADFLAERDINRKRAHWREILQPVASEQFFQFGAEVDLRVVLDELARASITAGYPLAANVVFESLLETFGEGVSRGVIANEDDRRSLATEAGVAVPALVRVAGFSVSRRDWQLAARQLDAAADVLRSRLGTEWRAGSERTASSMRELRPAMRLLAQLRMRLAIEPAARVAVGDQAARAFEDLQLAMLSETALSAQAAVRRRVTANSETATAIRRRDNALLTGIGLEWFRGTVERYGLTEFEAQLGRVDAERRAAEAEVTRLLPVPEDIATPRPLSLAETIRLLRPGEAVLVLHHGSDGVYGLVASPGRPVHAWISRVPARELEEKVQAVRAGLDASAGLPRFPMNEAVALHRLILGPASRALDGIRHLLVVADGALLALPLAVLPTRAPASEPLTPDAFRSARVAWLARSHATTLLPSIRALSAREVRRIASRAPHPFIGVANPVLTGTPRTSRSVDFGQAFRGSFANVEALRRLPRLPETEDEVRRIGAELGARPQDLLTQSNASEGRVKGLPLDQFRVLAFATHGLVGGAAAGSSEPGLVMTPPERASEVDDGLLTASEIAGLSLDADLVILSACSTAASDGRPRADGLSGLARSFLRAGARSVLATHWAIPSEPAVEITTRMFGARLADPQLDWGSALQRAMLDVVDRVGPASYAHPANWGAFIAVGLPPASP